MVSYSRVNTASSQPESITFSFQVGEVYRYSLGGDLPGCPHPCWQWDRDIFQIKIYDDFSIIHKRSEFRSIDVQNN